jgi:hypothetical protein
VHRVKSSGRPFQLLGSVLAPGWTDVPVRCYALGRLETFGKNRVQRTPNSSRYDPYRNPFFWAMPAVQGFVREKRAKELL